MNIFISLDMLKPSTLAAIIDDLYEQPEVDNQLVDAVLNALEESVGVEESISFLVDAGVDPELARLLFEE